MPKDNEPSSGIGAPLSAARTCASSPAAAASPTTSTARARPTPRSCAPTSPTAGSPGSTPPQRAAMPGVLRILTGADFADAGSLPCAWQIKPRRLAAAGAAPPGPRRGVVRHIGEPIAAVIAETAQQARDAAEKIELEIEELPAVVDMRAALEPGAAKGARGPRLEPLLRLGLSRGQQGQGRRRLRDRPHVTTLELVNNRLVANAMEPRAAIGEYDPATTATRSGPPARTRTRSGS